jgi:hypothetical protein
MFKINGSEYNVLITKDAKNCNVFYFHQYSSLTDDPPKLKRIDFSKEGVFKIAETTPELFEVAGEWVISDHSLNVKNEKVLQKINGITNIVEIGNEVNLDLKKEFNSGYTTLFSAYGMYQGEIKDAKLDGEGKCFYVSGDIYDGLWKEDKKEGRGVFTYKNGNLYNGTWNADEKEGKGLMIYENGDQYYGLWKKNKEDGAGVLTCPNGIVYDGFWKEGEKNGEGDYFFGNSDKFSSKWGGNMNVHKPSDTKKGVVLIILPEEKRYEGDLPDGNIFEKYKSVVNWMIPKNNNTPIFKLKIENLISERNKNQGYQVRVVINTHGSSNGGLLGGQDIVSALKTLVLEIKQHNSNDSSLIKKITRIKLNSLACFADKAVQQNGELYEFIKTAVQSDVEVRFSGVDEYHLGATYLMNSKNNLPSPNKKEVFYSIVEKLFLSSNSTNLQEVRTDWMGNKKYEDKGHTTEEEVTTLKGIKKYVSVEAFIEDAYGGKDKSK